MNTILLPFLAGLCAGVLSSWGVGGGTLLLLVMTLFLGVEQTEAQAINLLYFLPTAGVSLFFHHKNGLLDKHVLRCTVPAGAAAAAVCAWLAAAADPARLRRPFGLFLLFCSLAMLRQGKKSERSS